MKKILFIVIYSIIYTTIGTVTPDKYQIPVIFLTGWWGCLIWLWMFRNKKEKALENLYDCIKEIKKDGGILIHATKQQSSDLFDKLNNL